MNFTNLILESAGGVGWLTVNRPGQRNALDMKTLQEIDVAINHLSEDAAVRAVAITGAGDRAFISGADIAAMRAMTPAQAEEFAEQGHSCMRAIEECNKPVIAAVNGYALGGGMELVLACDIAIASEQAMFGLPEVKLGIFPGFGGTQRLPRLVGSMRAREMIFTGRMIDAAEAAAIGLVHRVIPAEALRAEVEKLAGEIASNGPVAVTAAKKLVLEGRDLSLREALESEREEFVEVFRTNDRKEGLAAFLEKRKPHFTGS